MITEVTSTVDQLCQIPRRNNAYIKRKCL